MIETFDEWHLRRHGATFESVHMAEGMLIVSAMRELTRLMRDYVSESIAAALGATG